MKLAVFLKSSLLYLPMFLLSFLFINNTLRLNNLKTTTAINAKISVFVICVEETIYLLLYNLHDNTFKYCLKLLFSQKSCQIFDSPSNIYLLKVNIGNTSKTSEIFSKLIIKTPEQRQRSCSDVFIANF